MWISWARTLVFNGALGDQAFIQTSTGPHGPHSQHPLQDRVAGLLAEERKPGTPPFSGPCNSSLLVFPEINGLSILGRQ